jgi:hypothetical protein
LAQPSNVMLHSAPDADVDLEDLSFERGAHLLVKHALMGLPPGGRLAVFGRAPNLLLHLETWCRRRGDSVEKVPLGSARQGGSPLVAHVVRGATDQSRWRGAERAGLPQSGSADGVKDLPSARWGVAARGALVEAGCPTFDFPLDRKDEVWADELGALYRQALSAQWDPFTAIDWDTQCDLPDEIEDAVVQLMTYLIENENAALLVPARFLARLHPHFKEVMQLLAIQTADEARHVEVFTRRALLKRTQLGLSTAGGQSSLKTLFDEPDFALAMFLLSVLGEGSFLVLLRFLQDKGPDPITTRVAELAAQDEARHVAFGMAHLSRHMLRDPGLKARLQAAVERRHWSLQHTAGLNEEVFDALVLVAAGSWDAVSIGKGYEAVVRLTDEMDQGRRRRLRRLGFLEAEAEQLSSLHTRNFM